MGVSNRHYLVIDLEATCWEQTDPLKGENEIIEIGLVILSPQKQELWRGGWFVRPQRNPILSSFCTQLTTIKQLEVDSAEGFSTVMTKLDAQVRNATGSAVPDSLFVSWGNYDRRQFQGDCTLHGCSYPFGEHLNLKLEFMRRHNLKRAGMDAALKLLELPLLGTHHRGVDDAVNISRILQKMADL